MRGVGGLKPFHGYPSIYIGGGDSGGRESMKNVLGRSRAAGPYCKEKLRISSMFITDRSLRRSCEVRGSPRDKEEDYMAHEGAHEVIQTQKKGTPELKNTRDSKKKEGGRDKKWWENFSFRRKGRGGGGQLGRQLLINRCGGGFGERVIERCA